jgi:quercetin dioxygenase-like cupin family protein
VRVGLRDAHMVIEAFPGFAGGALESWIAELPAEGSASGSLQTHAGEEFVYVLDGTIELLADMDVSVLGPGDAAHVRGGTPHQVRAGAAPARVLTVQTAAPHDQRAR